MNSRKFFAIGASTALLAFGVAACGSDDSDSTSGGSDLSGDIAGAGSSAQDAAQQAWIAGFQGTNPDAKVAYNPSGSGAGVSTFLTGATAWAGSDAALDATLEYIQQREAFNRPLAKFQVIRHTLADLAAEVEAARQFVREVGYPVILKPRAAAGASGTWWSWGRAPLRVARSSKLAPRPRPFSPEISMK